MKKSKKRVLGSDPFERKAAKPNVVRAASVATRDTPELQRSPRKRRVRDNQPTPPLSGPASFKPPAPTPMPAPTPPMPQSAQRVTAPGRGRRTPRATPPLLSPTKTPPRTPTPDLAIAARPTAPAGRRGPKPPTDIDVVAPAVEIAEVPRLIAGVTAFEESEARPRTVHQPRPSSLFAAARGMVKAATTWVRRSRQIDAFGRDAALANALRPVGDVLLDRYWNVSLQGLEHVPAGPCLLVANCGATLPLEGPVLQLALRRAGLGARWLLDSTLFHAPLSGRALNRLGAVEATAPNAEALLRDGQVVITFPEGGAAVGKRFTQRYQLQRFDPSLFEAAVATQASIVCAAICGAEEASPGLGSLPAVLGLPALPLTVPPLPGQWLVQVGPAFSATGDAATLARRAQDTVATLLGVLLRRRAADARG
jgi:1-acyl-sn-glycerol-3-phosphate acyltransferase